MAKMKTHRGSAKRFKRTATGLLKRFKAYKSHKTGKKSAKRVRNLRKGALVSKGDQKRIDSMLP
ncbi:MULTISPECIES: 50S ribosomal protein L35 [Gudongella]|jgi:large subunit ribosomal protein L35|uniref:50S ribosomal protein L35 n=1 Tax=Gudongella oleilytica TaxID=1582259 RepID=UPI000EE08342|nr:50S ribosomal protein L35 [Gudongella oleilytica]MDY0257517.1 50S ribosomal protein L35 [Gudongella oleilytica]HCO18599.1 50S ribosomal protein L35 [Tissierellales bacterium]HMM69231.1 50S ribosomal protein L35 [Gudongella oleilytica]